MKLLKTILGFEKEPDFIDDRRSSKRYDMVLKLNYSDSLSRYSGESLTKNISRNGLRFPVKSKLTKGELIDIEIEDPYSEKSLSLKGRVMWLEELPQEGPSDDQARYEIGVKVLEKRVF